MAVRNPTTPDRLTLIAPAASQTKPIDAAGAPRAVGSLDDATRQWVRRALASGLVDIEQIKRVVASSLAQDQAIDPQSLCDGLTAAGMLTRWQAKKLLDGRSAGFFLGHYRLLRPLGRGGMGVVYLGEHDVMRRTVALKVLPGEAAEDPRRVQRFKDEARASATLDHPNIVRAIDFAQTDTKLYIVMEFVDGVDLHQLVARQGPMQAAQSIDVIRQAAAGMAHAHERGIVHRDIKPSNLMLASDGTVKVSDLGLARMGMADSELIDTAGRLTGTADFMAPEQALNSKNVDARTDLYSLGCTWFFLLAGRAPYEGSTVQQRLAKHQTAAIPDVRQFQADVPEAVAELIRRLMAKRPADRLHSMAELSERLQRMGGAGAVATLAKSAGEEETKVDEPSGATLVDSGSVVDANDPLPDFDFGSLPSLPAATLRTVPAAPRRPASGRPRPGTRRGNVNRPAPSAGGSGVGGNQAVLLGVGLAFAFLALFIVVGTAVYLVVRPDTPTAPKLKISEDSDGKITVLQGR